MARWGEVIKKPKNPRGGLLACSGFGAFAKIALLACFFAALAIAAHPSPSSAQGLARKGVVNLQDVFNPKPDQLDLGLPMPCGLHMVFRVVGFNLDGKIKDVKIRFGIDDSGANGFFDHRHLIHLGSALSIDHLPPEWRPVAEAALAGARGDQLYLIGKYEVTNGQWNAVMGGECGALASDSARPKSDVSWYDVVDFTARYMEWLLQNSPRSLPAYGSQDLAMGVLRLPTEDEWEYAAMGGHLTSETEMGTAIIFGMPPERTISDYGLFRDPRRNPETQSGAVGRFLPNPLGIYDTVGNVAEMTLSAFKMTVGDRLHGSAGGFVRKGGSYIFPDIDALPGKRSETPLFRSDGPVSASDLGFRLALYAANTTGRARMDSLMGELAPILPPPKVLPDKALEPGPQENQAPKVVPVSVEGLDPLQKIDALIAAAGDPEIKERYMAIRGDLGDFRLSEAWQSEAAVRNSCRALIYVVYTTRNTYNRYLTIVGNYRNLEVEIKNLRPLLSRQDMTDGDKKSLREQIKGYEATLARMGEEVGQYEQTVLHQFSYYKKLHEGLHAYDLADKQSVNSSMIRLRQDIKGEDLYSEAMREAYDRVNQDVSSIRSGRLDKISLENLLGVSAQ